MKFLLLTRARDGAKQLVNMALVSEATRSDSGSYTTLVVPSAVSESGQYVQVRETPEEIAKLIEVGS
jgi:hypothetical protein